MPRYLLAAIVAVASCVPAYAVPPTRPTSVTFTDGQTTRTLPVPPAYGRSPGIAEAIPANGVCRITLGGQFVQFATPDCNTISRTWVYPVTTCPPIPPDATQDAPCPNGVGSYPQTHGWSQGAPPACTLTALPWVPTSPPAGSCVSPPPGGLNIDLSYIDPNAATTTRWLSQVTRDDATVEDMIYAYRFNGSTTNRDRAVANVDAQVTAAEQDIAAGRNPDVANDSYLYVDGFVGDIALAYPYASSSQRTRWAALADQSVFNVWNPPQAKWGGRSAPWSGWGTNDPQNNYHYHFIHATAYWALASNNTALLASLNTTRWPFVVNAMASNPGGGSYEGTGYGYSHGNLYLVYEAWRDSTGTDFGNANAQMSNSVLYWIAATVPTLDQFAPFGDQARISMPYLYDYQRALVLRAQYLSHDPAVKAAAGYWLQRIAIQDMYRGNYIDNLYPYTPSNTPPSLTYYAPQVGAVFARTAWATDAVWFAGLFGEFSQSHAHMEQGGFSLYKNGWQAVTNNVLSSSGINQTPRDKNILSFKKGGVEQFQYYATAHVLNYTANAATGETHITADLTPFYAANSGIRNWTRTIDFVGGVLTVSDSTDLATGTTATFQLQVPTRPLVTGNIITAGNLEIQVVTPATPQITVTDMHAVDSDYNGGWRVEFGGAEFKVVMRVN